MEKKKKVAILGYTPSREMAPFTDPEFEIWGINDLYKHLPKWDRWFELHTATQIQYEHVAKEGPRQISSWEANKIDLAKMQCPVYMQEKHDDIPNSVKFPLDNIIKHFESCFLDTDHARYFNNTISYLVAFAIIEEYEEIHIYGVDMATTMADGEYAHQRPSCEFWLGVAAGRGIKIHIPQESDLLKTRFLYAYEDEKKGAFEAKLIAIQQDVANKKANAIAQKTEWQKHEWQYVGAEIAIAEIKRNWQ